MVNKFEQFLVKLLPKTRNDKIERITYLKTKNVFKVQTEIKLTDCLLTGKYVQIGTKILDSELKIKHFIPR